MEKVNEVRKKKVAAEIKILEDTLEAVDSQGYSYEGLCEYRGKTYPVYLAFECKDSYEEQAAEDIIPIIDEQEDQLQVIAKRTDTNEWIQGYYVHLTYENEDEIQEHCHKIYTGYAKKAYGPSSTGMLTTEHEINPETLCRPTGIKDKNGMMIYENDIVQLHYKNLEDNICKVIFTDGRFVGEGRDGCEDTLMRDRCDIEIIGNIFDNADLMLCPKELEENNEVSSKTEYHTLRSAFKKWLVLHNEEFRMNVRVKVPSWFGYAIRNSKDYAYTVTNEREENYCNRCELAYHSRRRYKGHYGFYISDKELLSIKRPKMLLPAEIIEYKKEDIVQYLEDLKYWCNGLGELHYHGEYDITEDALPEELKRAYDELWTCGSRSLCYLVEYKGNYRIALTNEFDTVYASDINSTMDALYEHMKAKAKEFAAMKEFNSTQILIAEDSGPKECHEFIVMMPCDMEKEAFNKVEEILSEKLYI